MEVITLGETMLRLTPPGQQLIEQTATLETYVGGSESNVAIGLARLGREVAWVSRLTDNPLGRKIANTIRAQGVDVSSVIWTEADRVGTYYVEVGPVPRGSRAIYDRANSAMSRIQPADLPDDLFASAPPGWFLTSGITLAISDSAASTALHAIQQAKDSGWRVCFDVNYRMNLWTTERAVTVCDSAMQQADIIVIALRDAQQLYGAPADPDNALWFLKERFPTALLVMTLGGNGACAMTPDGDIHTQPAYPAQGSGRIGGGDAFDAGFLSAYIETGDVRHALTWGTATAAYKYTLPGDIPLLDRDVIQAIIAQSGRPSLHR